MTILRRPFFSLAIMTIVLSACATPVVSDLPLEVPTSRFVDHLTPIPV
jgi:hypothetical protein